MTWVPGSSPPRWLMRPTGGDIFSRRASFTASRTSAIPPTMRCYPKSVPARSTGARATATLSPATAWLPPSMRPADFWLLTARLDMPARSVRSPTLSTVSRANFSAARNTGLSSATRMALQRNTALMACGRSSPISTTRRFPQATTALSLAQTRTICLPRAAEAQLRLSLPPFSGCARRFSSMRWP